MTLRYGSTTYVCTHVRDDPEMTRRTGLCAPTPVYTFTSQVHAGNQGQIQDFGKGGGVRVTVKY